MTVILLIDDDADVRAMIRDGLERSAFTVVEAADGLEGVRRFQEGHVDLVVTDIIMPEREGVETIRELRGLSPGVPIIAISGGGRAGHQSYLALAARFGATRTLEKPFSIEEILEAIRGALG